MSFYNSRYYINSKITEAQSFTNYKRKRLGKELQETKDQVKELQDKLNTILTKKLEDK